MMEQSEHIVATILLMIVMIFSVMSILITANSYRGPAKGLTQQAYVVHQQTQPNPEVPPTLP